MLAHQSDVAAVSIGVMMLYELTGSVKPSSNLPTLVFEGSTLGHIKIVLTKQLDSVLYTNSSLGGHCRPVMSSRHD